MIKTRWYRRVAFGILFSALSPAIVVYELFMLGCLSIYLAFKRNPLPFLVDAFWGLCLAIGLYFCIFLVSLALAAI